MKIAQFFLKVSPARKVQSERKLVLTTFRTTARVSAMMSPQIRVRAAVLDKR
jgi:hypothetical protein